MVVHAEIDAALGPVICPYPPTPQNSVFFYINDKISMCREGSDNFLVQPGSVVVGPQLTRVHLDIQKSHKAVRVGFHPGGLHRLLGIPMSEICDESFDAADIFGSGIHEVNEQLQEAGSFDEIRDIIEKFLLGIVNKLKPALPFDLAMLELLKFNGNLSVEKVASIACLSLRQFERISKERIGMSPKYFSRLVRFSKAYRLRENYPGISWTNIAYECGYFDQMHLIRDFKQFAGVPPGVIEKELLAAPVRMQAALRI